MVGLICKQEDGDNDADTVGGVNTITHLEVASIWPPGFTAIAPAADGGKTLYVHISWKYSLL